MFRVKIRTFLLSVFVLMNEQFLKGADEMF